MDINTLRAQIDKIDDELKKIFIDRMEVSQLISQHKKDNNLTVLDKNREREILARVTENTTPELEVYIKTLFMTLFSLSRSYQNAILAQGSPLADEIRKAVSETPALFFRCRILCISTALKAFFKLWKKGFAVMGFYRSKTAPMVR